VITFDRGASWEYLTPPHADALGHKIECTSADHPLEGSGSHHCSLHLHGVTDVFGPFYSSPNAVGMLMVRRAGPAVAAGAGEQRLVGAMGIVAHRL
jgi:hypothetical protein